MPSDQNPSDDSLVIEPLMTVDDLARILKRSARTVRYWRSKGLLPEPDVVLERTVRWRPQTVADWIAGVGRPGG